MGQADHIPHPSSNVQFFIFLFLLLLVVYYTLKFLQIKRKYALATLEQQQSLDTRINSTINENLVHQNKPANTWQGFKNFKVIEKKVESWTIYQDKKISDICSFVLEPIETPKPLPGFLPGQHLSFLLDTPVVPKTMYYSLSDGPNENTYRVSIKRALPPPNTPGIPAGIGSTFFHDMIHEGDKVKTAMPKGHFFLNCKSTSDVILVAGGIGITPMISMAKSLNSIASERKIILYYGVRNLEETALIDDLLELSSSAKNFTCYLCLSAPQSAIKFDKPKNKQNKSIDKDTTKTELNPQNSDTFEDRDKKIQSIINDENILIVTGVDSDGNLENSLISKGCRVSVKLMKYHIEPQNKNYDFYLCGPPSMMKSVVTDLYHWDISKKNVHWEGFGPCAVMWPGDILNSPLKPCTVTFIDNEKDQKVYLDWKPASGSLMNMADEKEDVAPKIPRTCGAGFCGTCKTSFQGKVFYENKPGFTGLQPNECLPCVCKPDGDVILNLN
ncbi:MAG: hypothetical protein MK132_04055 [Lentisphaerales bacterium]|nr:hypothetical protein [Lentisphaerales bacterium]